MLKMCRTHSQFQKKYLQNQFFLDENEIKNKVEKILKGRLDSISSPSPSVKIQIMGRKGVKAKHCWVLSTNF